MPPTAAQHPSRSELAAFALGKLDRSTIEWIGRHLAECDTCRTVVETTPTDSLVDRLKGVPAGETGSWTPRTGTRVGRSPPPIDPNEVPPALRDHPKYRLICRLGEGGMGTVYQAEHTKMGRLVAVKVIHRAFVDHPEAVERFNREIKAVAMLNHPNIAQAYDAEQAGDLQLLAMEYVEGHSLIDVLGKKGPLPVTNACHYIRQAALGLQHAFERGMVHRDLKPHNLMLTPKGVVKILDFGLAKLASEMARSRGGLTQENAVMGTPQYMAPEQAINTKGADIRADIYALGCTLFHLLTGRPPFDGEKPLAIIVAHAQEPPPRLEELRPDVPVGLPALVGRMLSKKPADRPQTPKELAEALAPFAKAAAKAAPSKVLDREPVPAGGVRRSRRWLMPAVAGVFLIAASAVGIILTVKTKGGVVTLQVDPPNATVEVTDGNIKVSRPGDAEPWRIELAGGRGKLKISKAGFVAETREATLAENGTTIRVELKPEPPVDMATPPGNATPTPLPEPAAAKPELIAVWKHEVFERNKWMPRSDVLQFSNGRLSESDSIHTWTMTGNSLTFVWSRGNPIDRLTVSSDGQGYAGTNQVAIPIRGFLRWKKSQESPKAVLTAIWWIQVDEGGNWMPRPDALLLSNGKGVDSNVSWQADGKVLTFTTPTGVLLRATVSDDNRTFEGTSRSGQNVRGGLRWTKE